MLTTQTKGTEFSKRFKVLTGIVVASFVLLLGRLFQLQIVEGSTYRRKAENNFLHRVVLEPVRGSIKDRNGKVLVANRPSYNLYIIPRFFTRKAFEKLKSLLELDDRQIHWIETRIMGAQGDKRYFSLLAVRDIDRDKLALVETNRQDLPGVRVLTETKLVYPYGTLAAHLLGFVNEVSAAELKRLKGYRPGDRIGRYGVERRWESYLRGMPGFEVYVVDARGRKKSEAIQRKLLGPLSKRRQEPTPGYTLRLTIDVDVQKIVERALRWHRSGAAVVVEANTGRILAMASKPSFDPNVLSGHLTVEQARELYDNPYNPMLDKVVQGAYFPGSTYKVIPGMAALEERLVDTSEIIYCKGYYEYGKHSAFRCTHVHGPVNFHYAIVRSCNVFFYHMAERVGMDRMARYAREFGLGTPTGLGINSEASGFIPTKAWYNKHMPGGFRIGHTLNSAIGQGNVLVTPLQLAMVYATIANGGKLYLPQVVEAIEGPDGKVVKTFPPRVRRYVRVSQQTLSRIRSALEGVVNDPLGTAYGARITEVRVAGKTGTAQVTKRGLKGKGPKDWWRFRDHAWFAAYAPAENPEIVVVVLIEHGGSAGKVAAPVAMNIIKSYFELKRSRAK